MRRWVVSILMALILMAIVAGLIHWPWETVGILYPLSWYVFWDQVSPIRYETENLPPFSPNPFKPRRVIRPLGEIAHDWVIAPLNLIYLLIYVMLGGGPQL